jgi:hypothetical protein
MQSLNIWYIFCSSAEKIVQFYWRRKCLVTPSLAGIHARVNFVVKWNTRTELWASVLFPNSSCVDLGSHVIILKQHLLLLESATLWFRFCWHAIVGCSFGPRWIFLYQWYEGAQAKPRRKRYATHASHPVHRGCKLRSPCGLSSVTAQQTHTRSEHRGHDQSPNHFWMRARKRSKRTFSAVFHGVKKKLICFWLGAISVIWHSWSF